ncbi:hypothetical protein DSCA_29230 [Desulfosarcina alkanivorans]|uniref:histidine kinase n=1 Tax=Desulfosarcina alkanivorans TaxID=571177 RepID=A0A5K7YKE1_9BACT|nr:ATP-binding protein [Desulfosarcina alkanivorans]BBO68993.1 hypothetical protein DSCA_29230 [Desulfosarcina alkanivorans]
MPSRSLKKGLYIFIAAILVQACVMACDVYSRHRIAVSDATLHAIREVERNFLETLAEESHDLPEPAADMPLTRHYRTMAEMIHRGGLELDTAIIERRNQLYRELTTLKQEGRLLHQHLNRMLPSLTSSVRYIHEHHIAYLQNLISRGKLDQDYDTGEGFSRSPVKAAPELDIVKMAVAIQTGMLDIFETFSKLERGFSPAAISVEFQERIQAFYQLVNILEDYSLDAQDGLLVEELLLNGRTFENSFKRFIAIEKSIRRLSADKDRNRHYLLGQIKTAKAHIERAYGHLETQVETLQRLSLLVNAFMLCLLLFFSKRMIKAFRRTLDETGRIQENLSYQIPVRTSDFVEFGTIYNALNSMAGTINSQVVKLEESRDLLEERVQMRTSELSHVNNQLIAEIQDRIEKEKQHRELEAKLSRARKMEAIGTLAGGVAHDLNNILSGIISYPELILMDLPQDHPLRDSVMAIKSSGEKAATIVEDLLTLARRGIATHDPVDLNALVNQFIDSPECANILRHHPAVRMRSRLTPGIGSMMGSPVHLSKTIMNLVSNAAEAMPDGGTIDIVTTLKYIDFTIRGYDDVKEGEYLKLSVGDTGEGIAEEDLERIFEPFFTKKQMGRSGTGLGMAVVWGTVKDHAGYIDVKNRPGSGTTFSLYFPLNRAIPVKDGDAAIPPERYQGRGETVLVVDDVREQREIATRILEKIGYQVACVTSGEMAVAYLQQQPADILLLDMIMPRGIDGLETYRRVAEVAPGQKAVIASGFSESERVAEAQRIGAGPYIKKPYGIEQIGLVIREELDRPAIRKSA